MCEVIMVEQLANRRAPLFRGSGWETRPGLAVAFPQNKVRICFLVVDPWLLVMVMLVIWGGKLIPVGRPGWTGLAVAFSSHQG